MDIYELENPEGVILSRMAAAQQHGHGFGIGSSVGFWAPPQKPLTQLENLFKFSGSWTPLVPASLSGGSQ